MRSNILAVVLSRTTTSLNQICISWSSRERICDGSICSAALVREGVEVPLISAWAASIFNTTSQWVSNIIKHIGSLNYISVNRFIILTLTLTVILIILTTPFITSSISIIRFNTSSMIVRKTFKQMFRRIIWIHRFFTTIFISHTLPSTFNISRKA